MSKKLSRGLLASGLCLMLLAGCGGGGDGGATAGAGGSVGSPSGPGVGSTVESLLAFMNGLIDGTSETSEPVPLDNTPLPVDDTV